MFLFVGQELQRENIYNIILNEKYLQCIRVNNTPYKE